MEKAITHDQPLNPAQLAASRHGNGPLLIIAGAGSGKTTTLAHRVAELIAHGAEPRRMLLLTFTRRAATEMIQRTQRILRHPSGPTASNNPGSLPWAGTFHAIANRLLRHHAAALGLDPPSPFSTAKTPPTSSISSVIASGLAHNEKRFPRKGTCLAIYSRTVNAQEKLAACLERSFPWCGEWEAKLRELFAAYVEAKRARHVLDYDDPCSPGGS